MDSKSHATHIEAGTSKSEVLVDDNLVHDAKLATSKEHRMTLWQGLRLYPHAVGWSLLISSAIIMEGYDVVLMGSFFGFPAFNQKYGHLMKNGSYGLSAAWQSGLANAMNCGQILGLFANGIISERFGYRRTMMCSLVATVAFIFILFFAQNVQTLLVGEILMGIPLGVYQTVSVTYASEVCPVALRAYLTTYVNLCWVIGQLIASGVLKGLANRTDEWAYRIPFAVQWCGPSRSSLGFCWRPKAHGGWCVEDVAKLLFVLWSALHQVAP